MLGVVYNKRGAKTYGGRGFFFKALTCPRVIPNTSENIPFSVPSSQKEDLIGSSLLITGSEKV